MRTLSCSNYLSAGFNQCHILTALIEFCIFCIFNIHCMVHGQALGLHLKNKLRNIPPPKTRTHETNKRILINYFKRKTIDLQKQILMTVVSLGDNLLPFFRLISSCSLFVAFYWILKITNKPCKITKTFV